MADFQELVANHLTKPLCGKRLGQYHPSEVSSCLRKTWFSHKIKKQEDSRLRALFESSSMLQKFIINVLKSDPTLDIEVLKPEVHVRIEEKDFIISGKVDSLIIAEINKYKTLIDVKSVRLLPQQARKSHIAQMQIYMHGTGVKSGTILYTHKDTLETAQFDVDYDKDKAANIINRFRKLHRFLAFNQIPPAEAKLEKNAENVCESCPYEAECIKQLKDSLKIV